LTVVTANFNLSANLCCRYA